MKVMKKLKLLQEKPWYYKGAAFGIVALLLYLCFWYFVTSGIRTETANLQIEIDGLRASNMRAQIASQRINEFRAAYTQAQSDYEELKALLPEQRELTTVLQGLQDRARGRLSVRRFTPKEDFQKDFYSGKPIEVEVSGSYNNLGELFAELAAYQRIVSITDVKVNQATDQGSGRTVDAQFLLTAYYVSAEKLQTAATPAATPAAGAAPAAAPATK